MVLVLLTRLANAPSTGVALDGVGGGLNRRDAVTAALAGVVSARGAPVKDSAQKRRLLVDAPDDDSSRPLAAHEVTFRRVAAPLRCDVEGLVRRAESAPLIAKGGRAFVSPFHVGLCRCGGEARTVAMTRGSPAHCWVGARVHAPTNKLVMLRGNIDREENVKPA